MGTANIGIILNPNDNSFELYLDSDLYGLWNPETAMNDALTSESTSFIINYTGCPLMWGLPDYN
jgi:hypothetical protein